MRQVAAREVPIITMSTHQAAGDSRRGDIIEVYRCQYAGDGHHSIIDADYYR